MTTIKDIAQKADVSIATVSRILSGNKTYSFSQKTIDRVKEIAADLNYGPSKKRKQVKDAFERHFSDLHIAAVFWFEEEQEDDFLYYREIRRGMEKRLVNKNIKFTNYYSVKEFEKQAGTHEGIIAVGKFSKEEIEVLAKKSPHLVFVDSSPDPLAFSSVTADFFTAMRSIISYLVSTGHKRIGYIGKKEFVGTGPESEEYPDLKRESFRLIMGAEGIYDSKYVYVIEDPTPSAGFEIASHSITEEMPDALIVFSDTVALGVLSAFQEAHIKIPGDISIISFDDLPIAKYTYPSLSTVKIFTDYMGISAVDLLAEEWLEHRNERKIPKRVVIPHEMIVRNSSR